MELNDALNQEAEIGNLKNVDTSTTPPTNGQVLIWNGTKWVPGSGGAGGINDLSDVDTTTTPPTNGQALVWSGTNWVPGASSSVNDINDLSDVDTATTPPTTNQALIWDGTNWVPDTYDINDLSDVDTSTNAPANNQALIWDGTNWVPGDVSSVSGINDLSDVDTSGGPSTNQVLTWNGTSWRQANTLSIYGTNGSLSSDRLVDVQGYTCEISGSNGYVIIDASGSCIGQSAADLAQVRCNAGITRIDADKGLSLGGQVGTTGQVLQSNGGALPTWTTPSSMYTADGTITGDRTVTIGDLIYTLQSDEAYMIIDETSVDIGSNDAEIFLMESELSIQAGDLSITGNNQFSIDSPNIAISCGVEFLIDGAGGTLNIQMDGLPTTAPTGANKIWNDSGTLKIT